MSQLQLPIFPAGTTPITAELAFDCQDGKVTYLNGHLPVFQHAQEDLAAFRLFTSQLVVNGTVSQVEIARAFHVPPKTVKRYVKRLREGSSRSFFETPRRRSASATEVPPNFMTRMFIPRPEPLGDRQPGFRPGWRFYFSGRPGPWPG